MEIFVIIQINFIGSFQRALEIVCDITFRNGGYYELRQKRCPQETAGTSLYI